MEQRWNCTAGRIALFMCLGVVIGSLVTCFLAKVAMDRRDAVVVSLYQGLEGVRSFQTEKVGNTLDAYAHQANVVAIMEQKQKLLGLDLVSWSLWTPFASFVQSLIVPTPNNNWSEGEVRTQKNRLEMLSNPHGTQK